MYALHEQHSVFAQLERVATIFTFAFFEVVGGHFHLLTGNQVVEVVIEQVEVEGIERFKVLFAVLVLGRSVAVHKVVVERNHLWHQQVSHQLNGKALRRSGFAARRRTGKQHHACAALLVALCNLVGDAGKLAFVHGFSHVDEGAYVVFVFNGAVQFAHVFHANDGV